MQTETDSSHDTIPASMWLPAVALLVVAMAVMTWAPARAAVEQQAERFRSGGAYQAAVLDGRIFVAAAPLPPPTVSITWREVVSLLATILLAAAALFPSVLGHRINRALGRFLISAMRPLRMMQSGRVGDYVAWLVLGIAAAGALLVLLRSSP